MCTVWTLEIVYLDEFVPQELDHQRSAKFLLVDVILLYSRATTALQDYHLAVKSFAWIQSWFYWICLAKTFEYDANIWRVICCKIYFFGNLRDFLEERLIFGILKCSVFGKYVITEICYSNYCSFGRFKLAIFGRLRYLIFGRLEYFNFWEIERHHFREIEISHFRQITILQFLGDWNVLFSGDWNVSFSEDWNALFSGDWNVLFSGDWNVSFPGDWNVSFLGD